MDAVKSIKRDLDELRKRRDELLAEQSRLVRQRDPWLAKPTSGFFTKVLRNQDGSPVMGKNGQPQTVRISSAEEQQLRQQEAEKITAKLDPITRELRQLNEKQIVLVERLNHARKSGAAFDGTPLEAELAEVESKRAAAVAHIDDIKAAINSRAVAVANGDSEAIREFTELEAERDECERDIALFDVAIAGVKQKISEAKAEFSERAIEAARQESKAAATRLVEKAELVDAALSTAAALLREMRGERALLHKNGALASERINGICAPGAVARGAFAAGLGEFLAIDGRREHAEPLARSVRALTGGLSAARIKAAA